MSKILNGIDVSSWQGKINWNKAKPNIDFAILRCGYGSDYTNQDDKQFARNVTECERLNIPFGVYLYSYAKNEKMIESEAAHALRLIDGHKPFCVYIDLEDNSQAGYGKKTLTAFAKRFCETVKAKGYKVGVYANQYWFQKLLDVADLYNCGYSIWCAKYAKSKPSIAAPYDVWQYSASGKVNGVTGNVDMNYMYNDITNIKPDEKPTEEKPNKVLEWQNAAIKDGFKFPKYGADGKWGGECESVAKKAICKKRDTYKYKNLTKIVQRAVGAKVDGLFGNNTKDFVIAYQTRYGLEPDGIVGLNTWKKILGV